MAAYCCDTSGIVKRYVTETGSAWIKNLTDVTGGNRIYIAAITAAEVASAFTRRVRVGSLSANDAQTGFADFYNDFQNQYRVTDISAQIIDDAVQLALKHGLRGYDSVQLAAALQVRDERLALGATPPILVAADKELIAAAIAEGLLIENPNNYP